MDNFTHHFSRRYAGDRLDVACLLREGLSQSEERCALVYDGREVSVAELRARVALIQTNLRLMGVRPRQRVAVMLSNSVDHVALIYALILFGAVWVPVNARLRGAGLSHVVGHSRPELLIFDPEFEEAVCGLHGVPTVRLDMLPGAPDRSDQADLMCNPNIAPLDALCIIYTSGTTGAAKGVVFTHRMLRVASEAALMVADVHAGDRIFLWEPLCHVGGAQMLMAPFLADVQLHVVKRFSASQFWTQWIAAKATHLHYLGGVLDVLMQLPESDTPPSPSIRVAWGAGIGAQAWEPIRKRFGCELRECYGMTECSSFSTLNTSGTPGSIGLPLPWVGLELLDDSGLAVPKGTMGEIVLSSDIEGVFPSRILRQSRGDAEGVAGRQVPHRGHGPPDRGR